MAGHEELLNSFAAELKRGPQVLLVLSQLESPEYGYSLVQKLEEKQAPIEANTLYPMLRRLEKQGLLVSEWDTTESRPRKFYQLSEEGRLIYSGLKEEWSRLSFLIKSIIEEEERS